MFTVIGLSGGLYGHVFAYNNMRVIIFTWKSHAREVECIFLVFAHTGLFAVLYLFSALATASLISASSAKRGVMLWREALQASFFAHNQQDAFGLELCTQGVIQRFLGIRNSDFFALG